MLCVVLGAEGGSGPDLLDAWAGLAALWFLEDDSALASILLAIASRVQGLMIGED